MQRTSNRPPEPFGLKGQTLATRSRHLGLSASSLSLVMRRAVALTLASIARLITQLPMSQQRGGFVKRFLRCLQEIRTGSILPRPQSGLATGTSQNRPHSAKESRGSVAHRRRDRIRWAGREWHGHDRPRRAGPDRSTGNGEGIAPPAMDRNETRNSAWRRDPGMVARAQSGLGQGVAGPPGGNFSTGE